MSTFYIYSMVVPSALPTFQEVSGYEMLTLHITEFLEAFLQNQIVAIEKQNHWKIFAINFYFDKTKLFSISSNLKRKLLRGICQKTIRIAKPCLSLCPSKAITPICGPQNLYAEHIIASAFNDSKLLLL